MTGTNAREAGTSSAVTWSRSNPEASCPSADASGLGKGARDASLTVSLEKDRSEIHLGE